MLLGHGILTQSTKAAIAPPDGGRK
jgi:hypothetical protein